MIAIRSAYILILLVFFSMGFTFGETPFNNDTNQVDINNLKQGYWVYLGSMVDDYRFNPGQKVEEGAYADDKKTGRWLRYFPNGNTKNAITYVNSRPEGKYKVFYNNGQVAEEGTWKDRRQIGSFIRYHKNGKIAQEKNFNERGKSEGMQKYYHPNGQLELEFTKVNGKEEGLMKRYYPNGDLKEEMVFHDGVADEATVKSYEPVKPKVTIVEEEEKVIVSKPVDTSKDKPNVTFFKKNGFHILYNRNKQISQKGDFKDGRLKDGKVYEYDKDGLLISIKVFKNFRYRGEGVIEDE